MFVKVRTIFAAATTVVTCIWAFSEAAAELQHNKQSASDPIANQIWIEKSPSTGLPGVMLTFFSNGTLLQDSCWETYTLNKWARSNPTRVSWDENGTSIAADIISVSATQLVLNLSFGKTQARHTYFAAKVPFICPDMKR